MRTKSTKNHGDFTSYLLDVFRNSHREIEEENLVEMFNQWADHLSLEELIAHAENFANHWYLTK